MKIHYASDLHVEFGVNNLIFPGGDILLLAGDILVARSLSLRSSAIEARKNFFYMLENEFKKYKKVIAIMGNHEHYGNVIGESKTNIDNATTMYPFYQTVEDGIVDIAPGLKLFGATMWTDYNNEDWHAMYAAKRGMPDHSIIRLSDDEGERFRPDHAYDVNKQSTDNLVRALEEYPEDNFIVMTHHCPSMLSSHPKFGGSKNLLNYAFCNTKLEGLIHDYPRIKYWVHGHTHDSYDYMIEGCRVLCNPRGYQSINQLNPDFDSNKFFEV